MRYISEIRSNQIFLTRKILQRELYKILDIAYEKLYYVKDELLFIKMMIQKIIVSLLLKVTLEKDTRIALSSSTRRGISRMENFFERDWDFEKS